MIDTDVLSSLALDEVMDMAGENPAAQLAAKWYRLESWLEQWIALYNRRPRNIKCGLPCPASCPLQVILPQHENGPSCCRDLVNIGTTANILLNLVREHIDLLRARREKLEDMKKEVTNG